MKLNFKKISHRTWFLLTPLFGLIISFIFLITFNDVISAGFYIGFAIIIAINYIILSKFDSKQV